MYGGYAIELWRGILQQNSPPRPNLPELLPNYVCDCKLCRRFYGVIDSVLE